MSKVIKILIIFSAFLLATPALAVIDVSIDTTSITFSQSQAIQGEVVRIFTRVFNIGDEDVYGFVRFLSNGQEIGDPQPISVKVNTYDDVFIDWPTQAGTYNIQAEIISTNPADVNSANNLAAIQNYFVDLDTDSDGVGNAKDDDDDNDGVPDTNDAFPLDVNESQDTDNDGMGNNADMDDDNDGLSDEQEQNLGTDPLQVDTDGDGVSDKDDIFPLDVSESQDNDNDQIGDNVDEDDDNDGLNDNQEQELGTDPFKADTDEDGLSDKDEVEQGTDPLNADTDGDEVNDKDDAFPLDVNESQDTDNDGIGNNADINNNDKAPTAVLGYKMQKEYIILDAKDSYDNDGQIVKYEWDLGDGQKVEGQEIEYEYEEPGEYKIVLAVTDDVGQVSQQEEMVRIYKPSSKTLVILAIVILVMIIIVCVGVLFKKNPAV